MPGFHSLHGRRIGLTSTGGIAQYLDKDGKGSTAVVQYAKMWGAGQHATVTSTIASTLANSGFTTLSSGSATALVFEIKAPVVGVENTIHIDTSASEISFGGTSTSIIFASTVAVAGGSTLFLSRANLAGVNVILKGISTTEWSIFGSTTTLVVG